MAKTTDFKTFTRIENPFLPFNRNAVLFPRKIDGKFYAFGTPWSGKFDESINTKTEIAGIAFLSRGETNEITRVPGDSVAFDFMNQSVRPDKKEDMIYFMDVLDKVLSNVPIYRLKCNMSLEAVETSYNKMNPRSNNNEN